MLLNFYKYQGTGNDFILIDNRDHSISLNTEQIRFMCDRRFGIGADGLMLLEIEPGFDFKMVYFNSDGNQSSMCGNGGRCITAFASDLGLISGKCRFLAIDGPHEAVIMENNSVSLKMQDVRDVEVNEEFCYLNTGSPHYVTTVNNIENFDVVGEGKKIRYNDRFKEEGTNVNFIEKKDDAIFVRTYERGVEDETYSCGTGVTAAALVAGLNGMLDTKNSCHIKTLGGELDVKFEKVLEKNFYNIWLQGPAEKVFKGTIDIKE
ncbi:MAG: diaminopimelate epimerase [Bacteroidetes bacterium]|jgi:diaminopimelate epimerase|nr:diaminopimelate epimerase [Bacteroidota bacterium]